MTYTGDQIETTSENDGYIESVNITLSQADKELIKVCKKFLANRDVIKVSIEVTGDWDVVKEIGRIKYVHLDVYHLQGVVLVLTNDWSEAVFEVQLNKKDYEC